MEDHVLFRSIKGQLTTAEEAAVLVWRRSSADNERRYRELAEVLAIATRAAPAVEAAPPSPLKLVHLATMGASAEQESVREVKRRRFPPERWGRWAAAAAAVLIVGMVLGRTHTPVGSPIASFEVEEFVTGAAEAATVTLRDGTVVRLGPQSRLRLNGGEGRSVTLRGRALFSVARDPERPFRIETPGGSIEVLGTRFDLESRDDDLRVAVIEGRVALEARGRRTEVPAGVMRQVVNGATLPAVQVPDVIAIGEWAGNFLAFQDTPLHSAAAEISRLYGIRIEIADSALARQTITAWFSDQPQEQVMRIFCMVAQAQCTPDATARVITVEPAGRR